MNTLNTVGQIFKDYEKQSKLSNCIIEKINLYKKSNKLEVDILSEEEIDIVEIESFRHYLALKFKIGTVSIMIKGNKPIQSVATRNHRKKGNKE